MRRRYKGHAPHNLLARQIGAEAQDIMTREAGSMTKQIADRHIAIGQRVGELEPFEMFANGIVPGHLAFVDQHAGGRRGERLGARRNGEQGIGRYRLVGADFAHTIGLQIDDLIAADDRQRGAGNVPRLEAVLHNGIDGLGVDGLGRGRDGDEQHRREQEIDGAHGIKGNDAGLPVKVGQS